MKQEGKCAELVYTLYGTRRAAQAWGRKYTQKMLEWGFVQSETNPCIFWHPAREIVILVHGDDAFSQGTDEALERFAGGLDTVYKYKHQGRIGPEDGDGTVMRVLNRVLEWRKIGLALEWGSAARGDSHRDDGPVPSRRGKDAWRR